jgi:predicted nucleic-acid-binding protein
VRVIVDTNILVRCVLDEVAAGLTMMQHGGDFADGVIAYTGHKMAHGNAVFISFDKKAVRLLAEQGIASLVL